MSCPNDGRDDMMEPVDCSECPLYYDCPDSDRQDYDPNDEYDEEDCT
jgi:hypothetical protein